MRKALVSSTGDVVNVIEIEEGADWSPPADHTLVDAEGNADAEPGGHYEDGVFTPSPPPEPLARSRIEILEERLAALEARLPPE